MEIQDILTLIQAVDEHNLTELKLDDGDVKLSLKREEAAHHIVNVTGSGYQMPAGAAVMTGMPDAVMPQAAVSLPGAPASAQEQAGVSGAALTNASGIVSDKIIKSPLVGTFYNASSPEAEAFVKAGDAVKKGQILGIIEAMKLMNEIECEFDGIVEAVLVDNEDIVEYGQPLFRIR